MNSSAVILALLAGTLIALQFGVNASLRTSLGSESPFFATLVSYAVGTASSLACLLVLRPAWPALDRILSAPWWTWTGGAIGVGYVSASVLLAPRLGATALIILVIAGQILASLFLDHFGLVGYVVRPFNAWRAAGCLLVIAGVVVIKAN